YFLFSSRRRHTISNRNWSSVVCSSELPIFIVKQERPSGLFISKRFGLTTSTNSKLSREPLHGLIASIGWIRLLWLKRRRFWSRRSEERRVVTVYGSCIS